ncbi:uncharacterized protein LOC123266063 [Cotesia glomerata]|uniref:uncharacterized protein LOC123266063 n=1 Tax=Cotesia glomerata TaxID=32391 RepID=UPI001D027237|nr:uncharacterized protein LOC123266063 [Cotesia glomerata]
MDFDKKCINCNIYLRKAVGYKKVVMTIDEANIATEKIGKRVLVNDAFCSKCRVILTRPPILKNTQDSSADQVSIKSKPIFSQSSSTTVSSVSSSEDPSYVIEEKMEEELEFVELGFPRIISTHKYCCLCGLSANITIVPFEARKQVFSTRRLFIPEGNRCCKDHIVKKRFYDEEINTFRIYSNTSVFEVRDLEKLLGQLAIGTDSSIIDKIGDHSFSEKQLEVFTSLTWEKLIKLREMLTSMRKSVNRNVIQALVIFLFKLRTGNSNAVISSIFGLAREQMVSDYCDEVISSFEKDVLPQYFGIDAISRETLLANTSNTAKVLYQVKDDQLIFICDGTYIRHQKSANNEYQRKSYSGQKKVPLCKPFTICTTNGFVIDMLGPYTANMNDAEIMRIILSDPNGLIKLLKKGDIIVVDRGFRDVIVYLEELGFKVLMPALKGKRNQLTTDESNESRFVTKIRWVVEAVHGDIKQKFRILDHKLDNKLLPKTGVFCRIACFLHNEFGKRLDSDLDLSEKIIAAMNSKKFQDNTLASEVETNRWARRKVPFATITSDMLTDFPELTEQELKILFTGSYQMSQAVSYLAEMMDENETIILYYLKITPNIIKFKVRSRHIKSKTYHCFVEYQSDKNDISGITRYCCDCANGRRTVGCCSHIAAIIYYLSHARYLAKIVKPAEILSRLFIDEKISVVVNEDSDED